MEKWSIVILPYMVTELKLSGNDLIVYAFINGFESPEGDCWHGSFKTMSLRTGMSEATCKRVVKDLTERKLLQKKDAKPCNLYLTTYDRPIEEEPKTDEGKEFNKEVKQSYSELREKLFHENKIVVSKCCLNSGLINKRLKALKEYGLTPEIIQKTFEEMATDSFCLVDLNFDFGKLISERLFFQHYQKLNFKAEEEKEKIIYKQKICETCGAPLPANGICLNCEPERFFAELLKG